MALLIVKTRVFFKGIKKVDKLGLSTFSLKLPDYDVNTRNSAS